MPQQITELRPEQIAKFSEWAREWVKIGLSTQPADFDKATEAALRGYKLANLKRPMVILRMSSPYGACLGGMLVWSILRGMPKLKKQVESQVWSQVWSQVGQGRRSESQVESQVWSQVESQVRSQVESQVWSQVWSQVESQVESQVWSQVESQVRSQVESQVWSQVESQVWSQVESQVWSQVWSQVRSQVESQVWSQVESQVWSQVRSQVRSQVESHIYNNLYNGAFWAPWGAYVSFLRDICGWTNPTLERFEIDETLIRSCGWVWWHENILAISDRPEFIRRDVEGRLHCENGPSIAYRDGWSLWHWHGVAIPQAWIKERHKLTANLALTYPNIEQRRAAIGLVGWPNILRELKAKVIDDHPDPHCGTLVEVKLPDLDRKSRFLHARCGTEREFAIGVPADINTVNQAQAWLTGLPEDQFEFPPIRT